MQPEIRTGLSFDDLLLVPQLTAVRSRRDVDTSVRLAGGITLRVPILSANTQWCTGARMASAMAEAGGLGITHRMQTVEQQAAMVAEVKRSASALVGAAVGVQGDYRERAAALADSGVDLLLVDVAHGHADYVIEVTRELRRTFPALALAAGNVATALGVRDLAEAGADIVKVGIGPGGVCTTRLVAGSGVPQMTAIFDCAAEAGRHGVTIVADGGVRHSGDIAKALAAGATAVMLGSALAGCDESEAIPVERDGQWHKASRGFATLGMATTLRLASGERVSREEVEDYVAEGVEMTFPASGPLRAILQQLVGGVRSAMSYSGADHVREFQRKAEFVRVTEAGRAENRPHALDRAPHSAPNHFQEVLGS